MRGPGRERDSTLGPIDDQLEISSRNRSAGPCDLAARPEDRERVDRIVLDDPIHLHVGPCDAADPSASIGRGALDQEAVGIRGASEQIRAVNGSERLNRAIQQSVDGDAPSEASRLTEVRGEGRPVRVGVLLDGGETTVGRHQREREGVVGDLSQRLERDSHEGVDALSGRCRGARRKHEPGFGDLLLHAACKEAKHRRERRRGRVRPKRSGVAAASTVRPSAPAHESHGSGEGCPGFVGSSSGMSGATCSSVGTSLTGLSPAPRTRSAVRSLSGRATSRRRIRS